MNQRLAKIIWADSLKAPERQNAHHLLVGSLDEYSNGLQVKELEARGHVLILKNALAGLSERGMVKEVVH